MIPIANAAKAAGHTVAVAGQGLLAGQIEAAGFAPFATGPDDDPPQRLPLFDPHAKHEGRGMRNRFARRYAPHRASDLLPICLDWEPDLMVCGEVDFGAMVIAEHLGLPHAAVIAFATGQRLRPDDVAEPLNELRAEYGLPADPDMRMLNRYLRMSPFPPSFRHPEAPLSDGGHSFRYDPRPNEGTPPWAGQRPGAPTVYFTLGTVFNTESGDLFSRVLSGLGELPVNVLVTVGNNIDPAEFGPQPDNIHVARYVPQGQVLPHCDLVVSHAGSGSVLGAIAHGLPSVYIPIGADQPQNAARCVQLGLGRILDAITVTPPEIRDAVAAELADPAHRNATRRLRAEFAAQPSPEEMVPLLEKLVAETPAAPRLALPLG